MQCSPLNHRCSVVKCAHHANKSLPKEIISLSIYDLRGNTNTIGDGSAYLGEGRWYLFDAGSVAHQQCAYADNTFVSVHQQRPSTAYEGIFKRQCITIAIYCFDKDEDES